MNVYIHLKYHLCRNLNPFLENLHSKFRHKKYFDSWENKDSNLLIFKILLHIYRSFLATAFIIFEYTASILLKQILDSNKFSPWWISSRWHYPTSFRIKCTLPFFHICFHFLINWNCMFHFRCNKKITTFYLKFQNNQ